MDYWWKQSGLGDYLKNFVILPVYISAVMYIAIDERLAQIYYDRALEDMICSKACSILALELRF
jgi:hypothetical protein